MGLGKFLKNLVRNWLKEDEPVTNELLVILDGQTSKATAQTAVGTRLSCVVSRPEGPAVYLVGPAQAVDQPRFWAIWQRLKGTAVLTWEDGTPFSPNS